VVNVFAFGGADATLGATLGAVLSCVIVTAHFKFRLLTAVCAACCCCCCFPPARVNRRPAASAGAGAPAAGEPAQGVAAAGEPQSAAQAELPV
jgi:hypothetical protein